MLANKTFYIESLDIPGLSFRAVRGEEDADGIYELRTACAEYDQIDPLCVTEVTPSRQEVGEALARLMAGDFSDRRLLAIISGRVAGYNLVEEWHEEDGRWIYLVLNWVLPTWRGRGIEKAMLRWGEATARRLAATDHPGEFFEFAANATNPRPEATALLLNEGYYAAYTVLEMGLDFAALPPAHPLPPGLEVRPVQSAYFADIVQSIHDAYRNEYPGGRFQETQTREDSIAGLSASRQNPDLWQIAWAGNEVVGQVIPVNERGRVFMYDISVRPAWRRRGLARALLTRALWDLRGRGFDVIRLNTVAEFPTRACDLYESVGFSVLKEYPRYRKSPG
jgi:mycothiol synthase